MVSQFGLAGLGTRGSDDLGCPWRWPQKSCRVCGTGKVDAAYSTQVPNGFLLSYRATALHQLHSDQMTRSSALLF